ncbi:MAG TPA: hypothetical protein VH107_14420, partial [Lacipirellulaceae bacterium]|nr:hypothetical protein [Lacipirellulaceae bacterium]
MNEQSRQRLFGATHAFDSGVVRVFAISIVGIFVVTPIVIGFLRSRGTIPDNQYAELWKRYKSWLVLGPMMTVPVLLGAFWTIMAVGILSILC